MAVVRGGMMRRLLVAVLSVAIPALLTLLATSTPASAATRGTELTAGCTGSWQGRPGGHDILVIDCQPGFASAHDRIYIYPRSARQHGASWQDDLNMSDAVWLFDPGARNHPSLIVDFHRASQGLVADVYDDQDGDGKVEYRLMNGLPVPAETSFPTIHVVASDGWWIKDGKINYNLDIDVDGPVRVAFGSELYADLTRTDGAIDYRIQVRDEQDRGRPDWELIQAYPPLDESHGLVRSLLMVSTHGDLPITDYIFWPLLGVGGGTGEAERYSYGIVKDYNTSFAPIQVDWLAGKVQSVGELVASRGSASNWFVYSMAPLSTSTATYADFENPFAFYDLAGKDDGHPDLQIRSQYFGPSDPYGPPIDQPSEIVRYSWDQTHEHSWTYKVDLLGRNPINSLVHFAGLAVKTIPYQEYPHWVTNNHWDAATFVAVESGSYETTEGIYEWSADGLLGSYIRGEDLNQAAATVYASMPAGLRGEYQPHLGAQPLLYQSPIDHKLHLLSAQAGLWNLGNGRQMRYGSNGQYVDSWTLEDQDGTVASLVFEAHQLLIADASGVRVKTVDISPAKITILPPTDHASWARLGASLDQHRASFAGDDLRAMFDQFDGSAQTLPGATMEQFRATEDGFRFILGTPSQNLANAPWAAGLAPGRYAVEYRSGSGYLIQPLTAPALEIAPVAVVGQPPAASQLAELSVSVHNLGREDAPYLVINLLAERSDGKISSIRSISVDMKAGESSEKRFAWVPPAPGQWTIYASLTSQTSTMLSRSVTTLAVKPGPGVDPRSVIATVSQQGNLTTPVTAALLLLAGGVAAILLLAHVGEVHGSR